MVLDSSALLAILFREADADGFAAAVRADAYRLMSVVNVLECHMRLRAAKGQVGVDGLDDALKLYAIGIEPCDGDQLALARDAFDRFGKGRHAAELNFGDCFAYALSKSSGEPLLFAGDDFSKTDVSIASS